jgi:hypothetical protein
MVRLTHPLANESHLHLNGPTARTTARWGAAELTLTIDGIGSKG